MEASANLRFVRVAPRKARGVIDLIRGKRAQEALNILKFTPRHAARVLVKLLRSAVANAVQKQMGDLDALWVSKAMVDSGPALKRMRCRPRGHVAHIRKRTSHMTLVLSATNRSKKRSRPSSQTGG